MISLQLLTKKKQNTRRVYPDSQPPIKPPTQPHPSQPKGDNKFQSYL